MDRGHLLELVLEKKVETCADEIVHESSCCKSITKTTGFFTEGVKEVVEDEFFGHFEGFRVAVFESLPDA